MGSLLEQKIKTTTAQKDPSYMIDRIIVYVMYIHRFQKQFNLNLSWTIWSSIALLRKKVQKKSPWNQLAMIKPVFLFVWLGKADGTRLKPFIVFKGTKRESKALHDKFYRQGSVASLLTSGWMKNWYCVGITKFWVNFPFQNVCYLGILMKSILLIMSRKRWQN